MKLKLCEISEFIYTTRCCTYGFDSYFCKMPESLFQTSPEPSLVIDPSLESQTSGTCSLMMVAGKHFVQLALVERKSLKVVAIEKVRIHFSPDRQYLEKLKSISQLIKRFSFSGVKFVLTESNYTFIPESLYKAGDEYKFYRMNFHADLSSVVQAVLIPKFGTYCLFGIAPQFLNALQEVFPDGKVCHFSEVLLNNRFLNIRNDSGRVMHLNVRENALDITVTEGKKLILMNSFEWQTIEDVLYYSLFVSEQLGVNPDQHKLVIAGNVAKASALYKLLENYFSSIAFDELPGLKLGYGMEDVPFNQNPVIYGLSLCE